MTNDCLRADYPFAGKYVVEQDKYLFEFCPDHPNANKWGYVQQHRLVMERKIGRYLQKNECVHHKDENKKNNCIGNLQLVSKAEHMAIHQKLRHDAKFPQVTCELVADALSTGGLKKAAKILGVSQETIRRNFPELVSPYKRRSPADLNSPDLVEKLRDLAQDETIGEKEAAKILGCCGSSIHNLCEKNGIVWVKKCNRERPVYGYDRKTKQDDPMLVEKVKQCAENDGVSMEAAQDIIGVSVATIRRVLKNNNIVWKNKGYYSYPREGDK